MRLTSTETFKAKNARKKIADRDRLKEAEKIAHRHLRKTTAKSKWNGKHLSNN